MSLSQQLHSEATGLTYRWNGAHTVNIYLGDEEVDVFSFGDFAEDRASHEEFVEAVERHDADLIDCGNAKPLLS